MKRNHLFEVLLVLLMTFVGYGYFFAGIDWNTNSRLTLIKSIVEENRFEIDSYHDILVTQDKATLNGHFYSDKAIGSSLIGVVFYFPIYKLSQALGYEMPARIFVKVMGFLAISLICAFLGPLLYSFVKEISQRAWFALLVSATICLGTPLYKYSTIYYGHALVGLFLFTVFFMWFCMRKEEQISPIKVLISGYFLGYAIITEYPVAVIAFCIGLYILSVLRERKSLRNVGVYVRLAVGAVIPIFLALAYNHLVFGSPFKTGYSYEVLPEFLEGQQGGLLGIGWPNPASLFYMTFHTSMGVFWQSPVLLLAGFGWFRMWRTGQYRAEALFSFGVIAIYFVMMSGYYIWWGGAAFTPRNLIPAFPFFGIPLAFLARKWENILLGILASVSIAQMFIVTAANSYGIGALADTMARASLKTMFQRNSLIYNVYVPNFLNQDFGSNLGDDLLHLRGFLSLIPFFLMEACLLGVFAWVVSKRRGIESHAD